ncbi:hypothetical protein BDV93DRAFT_476415, partial [Ceratobasidium sp. AG-I]
MEMTEMITTIRRGEGDLRLLSLDGAGICGLSALVILQEFMGRLQHLLGLDSTPCPYEWFDLIVGSGTGGIIAILLGRLRMSADQAIEAYCEIMKEAFEERKLVGGEMYKAANLEGAVGKVVERCLGDGAASMIDPRAEDEGCKVFVCTMLAHNMTAGIPIFIRSYKTSHNDGPECTIVQAARATSATIGLFKPAIINDQGIKLSYVDARLGNANPTGCMLSEVEHIFPDRLVSSILSLGAGRTLPPGINNISDLGMSIATDRERVAQELARRFQYTEEFYFRFDVEHGLQDIGFGSWEKMGEIISHTRRYTKEIDVDERLERAVKAFREGREGIPVAQITGVVPPVEGVEPLKNCPPPSPAFTGQEHALAQIRDYMLYNLQERHVFVLHGLGGSGKTQLALQFVHLYRELYSDVFYIDATSSSTIQAGLKSLAVTKRAGKSSDDAIAWLATHHEQWLLIYNNADDTKLDIHSWFPPCAHGSILITTRNRQLVNHAQGVGAHYQVSGMVPEDGKELLIKTARVAVSEGVERLAYEIAKELGYLALAIVQAGAYICVHECTLAGYLEMYREYRGALLEEYQGLVQKTDDYKLTAYATWRVSYRQLHLNAVRLLQFFAFMHHEGISEDIFRYASLKAEEHESIALTDEEPAIKTAVVEFLTEFKTSNHVWYRPAFLNAINEIRSYSLLDFDPTNGTYSIHPLVHSWIRTTVNDAGVSSKSTALLLAMSIRREFSAQDYKFRATLVPHIDALSLELEFKSSIARAFVLVYTEVGRFQKAQTWLTMVVDADRRTLGDDHLTTLGDMHELAVICDKNGQYEKAEALQTLVVQSRTRVLGESHPETYRALAYLSLTYHEQGRYNEAEQIQLQVAEAAKVLLGPEHRETLLTLHSLAATYQAQGRLREAEALLSEVIGAEKRTLGAGHPTTLMSMHNLAGLLRDLGRLDEAEGLAEAVLEVWGKLSGENHPDTLSCEGLLASIYLDQNRPEDAEQLQLKTYERLQKSLGSMHPQTMSTMNNLACTYINRGRVPEAQTLLLQLLTNGANLYGSDRAEAFSNMANLVSENGPHGRLANLERAPTGGSDAQPIQRFKAIASNIAVVKTNLAHTFAGQSRWIEAESLMKEALITQDSILGTSHHTSQASRRFLAQIEQHTRPAIHARKLYPTIAFFLFLVSVVLSYC